MTFRHETIAQRAGAINAAGVTPQTYATVTGYDDSLRSTKCVNNVSAAAAVGVYMKGGLVSFLLPLVRPPPVIRRKIPVTVRL